MTREKMMKAILFGLKRSSGLGDDATAAKITDAVEMAFEMEADEPRGQSATSPSKPAPRVMQPPAPAPPPAMPMSPAVGRLMTPDGAGEEANEEAPLVILANPDDVEGQVQASVVQPISISRLKNGVADTKQPSTEGPETEYWSLTNLITSIEKMTPEKLKFRIEKDGEEKTVILNRNIIADHLYRGVKLSYSHPSLVAGELEVKHTFRVTEKGFDMDAIMDNLERVARALYRPRERNLENRIPVNNTPIDFSNDKMNIRTGVDGGEV